MNYLQATLLFVAGMHANKAISAALTAHTFWKNKAGTTLTSDNPMITVDWMITSNRNEAIWAAVVCVILLLAVFLYRKG